MDGKEAYDAIRRITAEIKILFISGYTTATMIKRGIAEEGFALVLKPVSPELLLKKIREVLDT